MAHDPRCNNVQRDINNLARHIDLLTEAVEEIIQHALPTGVRKVDVHTRERVDDLIHKIRYED